MMPLKIDLYWDLRSTILERHTGVGKHVIHVLNGLTADPSIEVRVLLARDQQSLWRVQSSHYGWQDWPVKILPFYQKTIRVLAGLGDFKYFDAFCSDSDLVYSPMELRFPVRHVPFVNTIHGLPFFETTLPAFVRSSLRARFERLRQRLFLYRCRHSSACIFTVSDYLKEGLVSGFSLSPDYLKVVGNGVEAAFFREPKVAEISKSGGDSKNIRLLQVGGANAFDGAASLVQFAGHVEHYLPDAKICIAGDHHQAPWREQLQRIPNVVWLGFLTSECLLQEMERATALVYVPDVESFGIIGAEAMAFGLPILARPTTALPEVLGDAAHWFDPANPSSIEAALKATCLDSSSREVLIQRGLERAAELRWSNVVDRVIQGLREVLHRTRTPKPKDQAKVVRK